jgi:hypothetical protein
MSSLNNRRLAVAATFRRLYLLHHSFSRWHQYATTTAALRLQQQRHTCRQTQEAKAMQRKLEVAGRFWELKRMHGCFSAWKRAGVVAQEVRALHDAQAPAGASRHAQQLQQQQPLVQGRPEELQPSSTLQDTAGSQAMCSQEQDHKQQGQQRQQQQGGQELPQNDQASPGLQDHEQAQKVAAFLKAIAAKQEAMYAGVGEQQPPTAGKILTSLQRPGIHKLHHQQHDLQQLQQDGKVHQAQQQQQEQILSSQNTSSRGSSSSSSSVASITSAPPLKPSIKSKLSCFSKRGPGKLITPEGSMSVLDLQQQQVVQQQRKQRVQKQQQQHHREESDLLEAKLLAEAAAGLEGALHQDDPDALLASLTGITEQLSWTQQLWEGKEQQGKEKEHQQGEEKEPQQGTEKELQQGNEKEQRHGKEKEQQQGKGQEKQQVKGKQQKQQHHSLAQNQEPLQEVQPPKLEPEKRWVCLNEEQQQEVVILAKTDLVPALQHGVQEQQERDESKLVLSQHIHPSGLQAKDMQQHQLLGVLKLQCDLSNQQSLVLPEQKVQQQQHPQLPVPQPIPKAKHQQIKPHQVQGPKQVVQHHHHQQQQQLHRTRQMSLQRLKRQREEQELMSVLQQEIQQQATALAVMHYQRGLVMRWGLKPWAQWVTYRREQMKVAARWWEIRRQKGAVQAFKEMLWHR